MTINCFELIGNKSNWVDFVIILNDRRPAVSLTMSTTVNWSSQFSVYYMPPTQSQQSISYIIFKYIYMYISCDARSPLNIDFRSQPASRSHRPHISLYYDFHQRNLQFLSFDALLQCNLAVDCRFAMATNAEALFVSLSKRRRRSNAPFDFYPSNKIATRSIFIDFVEICYRDIWELSASKWNSCRHILK